MALIEEIKFEFDNPLLLEVWLTGEDDEHDPQVTVEFSYYHKAADDGMKHAPVIVPIIFAAENYSGVDINSMKKIIAAAEKHVLKLNDFEL